MRFNKQTRLLWLYDIEQNDTYEIFTGAFCICEPTVCGVFTAGPTTVKINWQLWVQLIIRNKYGTVTVKTMCIDHTVTYTKTTSETWRWWRRWQDLTEFIINLHDWVVQIANVITGWWEVSALTVLWWCWCLQVLTCMQKALIFTSLPCNSVDTKSK